MWQAAADSALRFFNNVSDCMVQCAAVFGGGTAGYGGYRLPDLLRYTDKAIELVESSKPEEG
jgi:hypothetical protein|nr:MAG TPA: hypothetical protein [Caudoviricetes sp.]